MMNPRCERVDSIGPSPTQLKINEIKRPVVNYNNQNNIESKSENIPRVIGFDINPIGKWIKHGWKTISTPFRRRLSDNEKKIKL